MRLSLRLAAIFEEQDGATATNLKKLWRKKQSQSRAAALYELKTLEHLSIIGVGHSLWGFAPEYFADGVKALRPGHLIDLLTDEVGLPPLNKRKLLRIVVDRERVGGAFVGYLISRLRMMEVNDPAHIFWRIVQNGFQAAGLNGCC